MIEGASYALAVDPDPKLDAYVDGLIAKIAAAQEPDGYIYTTRTINPQAARTAGPAGSGGLANGTTATSSTTWGTSSRRRSRTTGHRQDELPERRDEGG